MSLVITKLNEATLQVTSDDFGIEQELCDFFTFPVPGHQFMPTFKAKIWDGRAKLYDIHRKTLPVGLLEYAQKFAKDNEYECRLSFDEVHSDSKVSLEEVRNFIECLNIHTKGKKIELRDYQVDAIHRAINKERMLALSPTSSGKSAIIYVFVRWHLEFGRRIVLMVPTTSLVSQMFSDFEDYASEDDWDADEFCHQLYSGKDKETDKPVLITTWQSIHSMTKNKKALDFYKEWDVYIGDEAHRFASNSLQQISSKLIRARYRLGTTGTIQDAKVSKLSLEGSFGPVYRVITTKELMDANQVVKLNIKCLLLDYDEETRKLLKGADYQKEIDYIVSNEKRNRFIVKLAKASKGNTLILFQFVEKQGKPLYDIAKELCDERPLFYISGEVTTEERERIRKVLDTHEDAIVICSYGTTSTGINIPSIENIIFASPTKSKIRNLQSIGRGLRLKEGKESCKLYDIADNFSVKSKLNHTMKHLKERIETYQAEQFTFDIKTIKF
jgi:superfamily II DNA or RNA helicase